MTKYDIIVVGSGNGACGFLNYYLEHGALHRERVLVLEEGNDFFDTSDISHQSNWTQSYAEGDLFRLHQASTSDNIPIIRGRARCMGGGGSINYSMIHESSEWLTEHIGQTKTYWDRLKEELNCKFARKDPHEKRLHLTSHVLEVANSFGFEISQDKTCNIPNYRESDRKLLHLFPNQFNFFGQRTNSGVSLVDWSKLDLKTKCRVVELKFSDSPGKESKCTGVSVRCANNDETANFALEDNGRLILCAGADTPRLLLPHRSRLQNFEIGKYVNDHVILPLGIYILDKKIDATPRDVYVSVFATTLARSPNGNAKTVCCFDFFSGNLDKLAFLLSHIYFAFVPNFIKKLTIGIPWLFWLVKNILRLLIQSLDLAIELWLRLSNWIGKKKNRPELDLITVAIKFNPTKEGYYANNGSRIVLPFFLEEDKEIAKQAIEENIDLLNYLGEQPPLAIRFLIRCLTKIPYRKEQIDKYVDFYSKNSLLSEQHLSGGCLFGKAIDNGAELPANTGKVYGTTNAYVADLSSVPLPRISPQMTAYLVGFHVAKMLYDKDSAI